MGWLAVDKDSTEWLCETRPCREPFCDDGIQDDSVWIADNQIKLPKGTIRLLSGKEMTWNDEPIELKESSGNYVNFTDNEINILMGVVVKELGNYAMENNVLSLIDNPIPSLQQIYLAMKKAKKIMFSIKDKIMPYYHKLNKQKNENQGNHSN